MIIFLRISGSPDFKLISKFMTSRPGSETSAIQIFPNISRSKGNPTIKFGQLKECNMRNTLSFEKSYTKFGGETIPRPFFKKSKLIVSIALKFYRVYFFVC